MENITSSAALKDAILLLETEQSIREQVLKERFYFAFESLKPVNILKNTMNDITSSPYLIDNLMGTVLGLATGYLSKKLVVGVPVSIVRKLFGTALQLGVTNVVARHPDALKLIGQFLVHRILRKK